MGEPEITARKPQPNDWIRHELHLIMLEVSALNNKEFWRKSKTLSKELLAINNKIQELRDKL